MGALGSHWHGNNLYSPFFHVEPLTLVCLPNHYLIGTPQNILLRLLGKNIIIPISQMSKQ